MLKNVLRKAISQDDMASDIKEEYIDQLYKGIDSHTITQNIQESYADAIKDEDDAPIFWIALADVQWTYGRLEPAVKEKALYYLKSERDRIKWNRNSINNIARNIDDILDDLQDKLNRPQPEKRIIKEKKLFRCSWNVGDVFAYKLTSKYAETKGLVNKYIYFIKCDEMTWHPGHIIPIVNVFWTMSDTILSLEDVIANAYLPQFYVPAVYEKNKSIRKMYRLSIITRKEKAIPRNNLLYLGNSTVHKMDNEEVNPFNVSWKDFEKYIIDDYLEWICMKNK